MIEQRTYSFRWFQLRHDLGIAFRIAFTEGLHKPFNLLRLAWHPEEALEFSKRHINSGSRQVKLFTEGIENRHVEWLLNHSEVFADHLAWEPLARYKELCNAHGRVFQEACGEDKAHSKTISLKSQWQTIYRSSPNIQFPSRASCWTSLSRCDIFAFEWFPKS